MLTRYFILKKFDDYEVFERNNLAKIVARLELDKTNSYVLKITCSAMVLEPEFLEEMLDLCYSLNNIKCHQELNLEVESLAKSPGRTFVGGDGI